MLLLHRTLGETIHIGDDIVIQVTSIEHNQVVIGVIAPSAHRILRGELVAKNKSAAANKLSETR